MKYQSELIKEIADSRGHEKSSLHYQSECIETWIEESKGAYPKLCDYESEWLNYISMLDGTGGSEDQEPPIGEFPYETVSTNTTATVNNVVPYAYRSAILKGMTLVNLVSNYSFGGDKRLYESRFYDNPIQSGETLTVFVVNPNISTIKVGLYNSSTNEWKREQSFNVSNIKKVVYTIPSDLFSMYVGVVVPNKEDSSGFENGLVIMRGDQSQLEVNTYFEGMQSVKLPVLTTTNEDGTKTNILTVNEDVTLRSKGSVYDELDLLTGKLTQRIDENGEVLSQEIVKTVDLTITDQDDNTLSTIKPIEGTMHITPTGEPIAPTAVLEVPVEAVTQNLASFIEEE